MFMADVRLVIAFLNHILELKKIRLNDNYFHQAKSFWNFGEISINLMLGLPGILFFFYTNFERVG